MSLIAIPTVALLFSLNLAFLAPFKAPKNILYACLVLTIAIPPGKKHFNFSSTSCNFLLFFLFYSVIARDEKYRTSIQTEDGRLTENVPLHLCHISARLFLAWTISFHCHFICSFRHNSLTLTTMSTFLTLYQTCCQWHHACYRVFGSNNTLTPRLTNSVMHTHWIVIFSFR